LHRLPGPAQGWAYERFRYSKWSGSETERSEKDLRSWAERSSLEISNTQHEKGKEGEWGTPSSEIKGKGFPRKKSKKKTGHLQLVL